VLSKSEVHLFVYSESCRGEAQGLVYRNFAGGQVFSLLTGEILLISYLTGPSEGQVGFNLSCDWGFACIGNKLDESLAVHPLKRGRRHSLSICGDDQDQRDPLP